MKFIIITFLTVLNTIFFAEDNKADEGADYGPVESFAIALNYAEHDDWENLINFLLEKEMLNLVMKEFNEDRKSATEKLKSDMLPKLRRIYKQLKVIRPIYLKENNEDIVLFKFKENVDEITGLVLHKSVKKYILGKTSFVAKTYMPVYDEMIERQMAIGK